MVLMYISTSVCVGLQGCHHTERFTCCLRQSHPLHPETPVGIERWGEAPAEGVAGPRGGLEGPAGWTYIGVLLGLFSDVFRYQLVPSVRY